MAFVKVSSGLGCSWNQASSWGDICITVLPHAKLLALIQIGVDMQIGAILIVASGLGCMLAAGLVIAPAHIMQ